MRSIRIKPLWRPVYKLQQRKVLPLFWVILLITSNYFQLKHPFKPVFINLVNSVDELPPAVRALLKVENKKVTEKIDKAFKSSFIETPIIAMMVFLSNDRYSIPAAKPNVTAINAPDKPYLRQFSPPPEV